MKTKNLACVVSLLILPFSAQADPINPAIVAIKNWLLFTDPDGLDNGMRKSITYASSSRSFGDATLTYEVPQSSAIARTTKFLSEYYLTYQNVLNSYEKLALYNEIKIYAKKILQHRKYATAWGWDLDDDAALADANLETNKFYYGAVATSSSYLMFTGLGNSFACEGLVAAARVADLRGDAVNQAAWRSAALLIGDFLRRLSAPSDYYKSHYNVDCMVDASGNPSVQPGIVYGMVSSHDALYAEAPLQNLYAIVALKDLADFTNIPSYYDAAIKIRDQMCPGLQDFNNSFYIRFNANGSNKIVGSDYQDNAWHPLPTNQVGDDNIEYALAALWKFHGLSQTNNEFTYDNGTKVFKMLDRTISFHTAPAYNFSDYDPYLTFTGYFKKYNGVWMHQMPYYDMVGFGLLGELRHGIASSDYLRVWNRVVHDRIESGRSADLVLTMTDKNLNVYWTSTNQTSKSTLVSVAIGLSLMKITPYYSSATQP